MATNPGSGFEESALSPRGHSDGVHLSYDSMESLIAPYGSDAAVMVARDLDAKIEGLLETARL